jgi:hypothetical protein
MAALKKGDRVRVAFLSAGLTRPHVYVGTITGESRDGKNWWIHKDGTKYVRDVHKSFCSLADETTVERD